MTLLRLLFVGIILAAVFAACGGHGHNGFRVSGDLLVNGPGLNGGVQLDVRRVYALKNIIAGNNYTVRTQIAPGGTLTGDIYLTADDYLSSSATSSGTVYTTLVSNPTYTYIYEVNFTAPTSGDYYIAVSGVPSTKIDSQFFYDLQLLSSTVTTSFATAPTSTTIGANTATVLTGYVHIYSGSTVTPPGTYTVSLTTKSTNTLGNPQMFVYADSTLSVDSLLFSSYTTTVDYMITTFATGTSTTVASTVNEIPGIAFTAAGPYIVVKGNTSIEYTVTVY